MATTKRFQLFADYFHKAGCFVSFVLKVHTTNPIGTETGIHKEMPFYKVFFKDSKKYPFYYDKRQHKQLLEIINNIYKVNERNIILTGGVSVEFLLVLRKLIPRWELYCDYVEDFMTLSTHYSGLWKQDFWLFLKSRISVFLNKPLISISENYMFRNAMGISAISPYLYKKAHKYAVNVIDIPVTADRFLTARKSNPNNQTTLFFAGTGSLKDGLEIIAKAFDILSRNYDVCLKISGKLNPDAISKITSNCGYIANVVFLGFLNNDAYFEELKQADIMLMTRSNTKFANAGFPFKLGEYLATANPVVATRVSGVEMYLKDKINAMLVEPDDVDGLVKGISYLIENKDEATRIGKEGYKVFEEHFNAETNCERFYNFILSTKKY